MSKSRQTTLFQTWSGPKRTGSSSDAPARPQDDQIQNDVVNLCDDEDDDEDLLKALELSLLESKSEDNVWEPRAGTSGSIPMTSVSRVILDTEGRTRKPSDLGLFKVIGRKQGSSTKHQEENRSVDTPTAESEDVRVLSEAELLALEDLPGFDKFSGQRWIYPTNYPVRDYQFNIVKASLFKNTLVVLPTGLGKTFVAAVVMYNFYRWYPQGKIIFMAPTKPLVAQQIEACYNIMGIPQDSTAEMTGAMQPAERKREWQNRRVFFLTPQVLTNDLSRGACPALFVKCLVVDEAHKALGNHAYCQVVRELAKHEGTFRVLALSATPGSDLKAVQKVISNLLISHVELRGDESPDIKPYTHERRVDKIVVKLGDELNAAKTKYIRLMEMVVNRLKRMGVLYNRDVTSLSKFLVLKAREAFRQNPPHNLPRHQYGVIEGDFALAMSLYHGYDLLLLHGLRPLHSFLHGIVNGEKGHGRTRAELQRSTDFTDLMEMLQGKFALVKNADPNIRMTQTASQLAVPFQIGHPKIAKLQEVVLEHFNKFQDKGESTRIMIFSQYRDSVSEITEMLNRHRPLVKVMSFIGQSSTGKDTKGFSQKDQLRVMRQFREGGFNTLVSTCVGEEGLDIGDVDLIICFDAHKSPIRLVQRMGRTGRKREGRIIMLVTEGKEENIYNQSQYSKRSIHKAIENGAKSLVFFANDKRMVPEGLNPQCHRMHITVHREYKAGNRKEEGAKRKANTKPTTKIKVTRKKAAPKDGFLSEEELKSWSENYKVNENEIPSLSASHFVTLKTESVEEEGGGGLSLNAWMPWQNRLQATVNVSHSDRTRMLVDLMEFMDVQSTLEDDEDVYGQEMQLYLNKDDVHFRSKPTGIARFCQVSTGTESTDLKRKRNDELEPNKRMKRSEQLPGFSSDEDEFQQTDDEDDLPTFDGKSAKPASKSRNKHPPYVGNQISSEVPFADSDIFVLNAKGKGKGKGCSNRQNNCDNETDKNDGELSTSSCGDSMIKRKAGTKKRRSSDLSYQSVNKFIGDHNSEDFEGCDSIAFSKDFDMPQRDVDCNPKSVCNGELTPNNVMSDSDDGSRITPPEIALTQALPDFSSQNTTRLEDAKEADISHQVASPPTSEELSKVLNHLEAKGRVSPVDLLNLIEKWEKERTESTVDVGVFKPADHGKASVAQVSILLSEPFPKNVLAEGSEEEDCVDFATEDFDEFFFDGSILDTQNLSEHKNDADVYHSDEQGESTSHVKKDISMETDVKFPPPLEPRNIGLKSEPCPQNPESSSSDTSTHSLSPVLLNRHIMLAKNTSTPVVGRSSHISVTSKPSKKSLQCIDDRDHGTPEAEINIREQNHVSEHVDDSVVNGGIAEPPEKAPLFEDSFFANETCDQLFAAFETPQPAPCKKRSPLLPKASAAGTLMTFTQALNCVDDSLDVSKSFIANSSSNESDHSPGFNQNEHPASSIFPNTEMKRITGSNMAAKTPCLTSAKEKQKEPQESNMKSDENVQFDLGFDLDEFDDEMIIPPSPVKETSSLSQRSRPSLAYRKLSTSFSSQNNKSQRHSGQCQSAPLQISPIPEDESGKEDSKSEQDLTTLQAIIRTSETDEDDAGANSQSLLATRGSSMKACSPSMTTEGPETFIDKKSLTPVAVVKPCITKKVEEEYESNIIDGYAGNLNDPFGDDHDSDDLFNDLDPDIYLDAEIKAADDISMIGTTHPQGHHSDEDDDSFIIMPRGRRKVGQILSQNTPEKITPFKTPTKPAPKTHKKNKTCVSEITEEDSPILPPKKFHKHQKVLFDDDSPVAAKHVQLSKRKLIDTAGHSSFSDDDDDFADYNAVRMKSTRDKFRNVQRKGTDLPIGAKKKKTSAAAGFLDMEAERSEDDCSEDDSEGSHLDDFEDSFINDCSQMTQSQPVNESDMRAIYRQSTRSPIHSGSRFKMVHGRNAHIDVFSQIPQQDSEYMEDSFVVHEDDDLDGFIVDDVHEVDDFEGEVTLLHPHMNMTMSRQTRRQARLATIRQGNVKPTTNRPATKSRKRVVQPVDSSSEDEVELPSTQVLMGAVGRKVTSDSSTKSSTSTSDVSMSEEEPLGSCLKGAARNKEPLAGMKPEERSVKELYRETDHTNESFATQMPSLQTRCQRRLHRTNDKDSEHINDGNPIGQNHVSKYGKENKLRAEREDNISGSVKATLKADEDPTFSLATDFIDDDWDEYFSSDVVEFHASPHVEVKPNAFVVMKAGPSTERTIVHKADNGNQNQPAISPPQMTDREKRLKMAKQKKEKFLRESRCLNKTTAKASPEKVGFHGTQIHPPPLTPAGPGTNTFNLTNNLATPNNQAAADSSFVSPIGPPRKEKLLILVDSREINAAPDILSALRFQHNARTVVRSLNSCDYILSNRLAVDRISFPDFTNGTHKARLVARVREMCELYDRPCLIIERERLKAGEKRPSHSMPQTKYVSNVMAALSRTHVKILYSENQDETARLLSELTIHEQKKNQAIRSCAELSTKQEQVLGFYLSLPKMSYIMALNLSNHFRTIADFIKGSEAALVKHGGMSQQKAKEIQAYLRRGFDPQMLSMRR